MTQLTFGLLVKLDSASFQDLQSFATACDLKEGVGCATDCCMLPCAFKRVIPGRVGRPEYQTTSRCSLPV